MKTKFERINIINYLAVLSLEKLGNLDPSEKEIAFLEKTINKSIKNSLQIYQQKIMPPLCEKNSSENGILNF